MIKFLTELEMDGHARSYEGFSLDDIAVIDTETGIVYQSFWYDGSLRQDVKDFLENV